LRCDLKEEKEKEKKKKGVAKSGIGRLDRGNVKFVE
jgi:hypothetical protein